MRRTGGLRISRVPMESILIRYPDGFEIETTVGRFVKDSMNLFFERRWPNGDSLMDRVELKCGEFVELPGETDEDETVLGPEYIEHGKCIFRIIAPKSVVILRTELVRPELRKRSKSKCQKNA